MLPWRWLARHVVYAPEGEERTLNNAEATAGVAVGVGVGVGGAVALDEDGGARLKVSKLNRLGRHDIC